MFVQSSIWNASEERDSATIQSIQPNQRQKIFNKIKFSLKLQEWTNSNGMFILFFSIYDIITPTPILDYNRVAQVVNDCKIRVRIGFAPSYSVFACFCSLSHDALYKMQITH